MRSVVVIGRPGARAYQNIIRRLEELLVTQGIEIPEDLREAEPKSPLAAVELVGQTFRGQRLEAHMPAFDACAPCPYDRSQAATSSEQPTRTTSRDSPIADQASFDDANTGPPNTGNGGHPHGLDSTQTAVNFVLALEQPCMLHFGVLSPELLIQGSVGTGHEAMLSSPVMARAPNFSFNPLRIGRPHGSQWSVPAAELERLLDLSHQIDLDGEITPVQAWQRIRYHPSFGILLPEQLEFLRDALLPEVKCYG